MSGDGKQVNSKMETHNTTQAFLSLKEKLSTKKYSIPKWAYYQDHLSDDFVPLAPSMIELMGKGAVYKLRCILGGRGVQP